MSKSHDISSFSIKPNRTDRFVRALAAHPYLCALAVCLGINPFYFGADINVPSNALYIELFFVLAAGFGVIYHLFRRGVLDRIKASAAAALYFVLICFTTKRYAESPRKGLWMFVIGFALLTLVYYFAQTKKYKGQLYSLLIMSTGFLLKFYYVFYTSCYTRQNDVHSFGGEIGHAAYMEYLLFNRKMPDFDVRNVWQFCHPPLHHFISAVWIGVNEYVLGIGYAPARESLQTLTLFYSMTIIITAYKIFRHFKLSGTALYIPLAIVSYHPCFVLLSGSINNDVLSVAFMMGAFLCTLKWYEDHKLSYILKIALCVGLGMMTKLSAALVAPPIALVFLIVFIKELKTNGAKLFGQFAAFGVLCVPLGLWFGIRNYINYRVPITYVQEMSTSSIQYLGELDFVKRVTDFSPKQFSSVFEQWIDLDENSYNEYNPLITLLKNSIFGESIREVLLGDGSIYVTLAKVLFWLAAFIAAMCFVMMIYNIFTKSGIDRVMKLFWGSFYLMMMVNFYKMANDYPFTCTMNFRYITPTVIIGAFFAGVSIKRMGTSEKPAAAVAVKLIGAAAALFCALSAVIYIQVCLPAV